MLNISVDEAYAYDFLSILDVKKKHNMCNQAFYDKYFFEIQRQVGQGIHEHIINSSEYKNMIAINEKIFKAVDLAKLNQITASEVNDLNYQRYIAKSTLQKAWFPQNIITETKN